jgi:hypothetical protein
MTRRARHLLTTVVVVWALALAAGFVAYRHVGGASRAAGDAAPGDSLAWLRAEFALGEESLARVAALHARHLVVCEEHCASILAARATLRRLDAEGAPEEAREAARAEARRIDEACRASVEAHVAAVAEAIGGAEGERYLRLVRERALRAAERHAGAAATGGMGGDGHGHGH